MCVWRAESFENRDLPQSSLAAYHLVRVTGATVDMDDRLLLTLLWNVPRSQTLAGYPFPPADPALWVSLRLATVEEKGSGKKKDLQAIYILLYNTKL